MQRDSQEVQQDKQRCTLMRVTMTRVHLYNILHSKDDSKAFLVKTILHHGEHSFSTLNISMWDSGWWSMHDDNTSVSQSIWQKEKPIIPPSSHNVFSIGKWLYAHGYAPHSHKHTHFTHLTRAKLAHISWSTQMSNPTHKNIPGSTLSEGHYRLEVCQNVWDLVPGAQSILHVCHWIRLPAYSPERHMYVHFQHINLLILTISSIKLHGERP